MCFLYFVEKYLLFTTNSGREHPQLLLQNSIFPSFTGCCKQKGGNAESQTTTHKVSTGSCLEKNLNAAKLPGQSKGLGRNIGCKDNNSTWH